MSTELQSPLMAAPPAKFSRYKSVRNATKPAAQSPNTPDLSHGQDSVQRSMSRYRKSRGPPTGPVSGYAPPTPAIPQQFFAASGAGQGPVEHGSSSTSSTQSPNPSQNERQRRRFVPAGEDHDRRDNTSEGVSRKNTLPGEPAGSGHGRRRLGAGQEGDILLGDGEKDAKAEELIAEQKRQDLARLEAQLATAVNRPVTPAKESPSRERRGLFGRRRENPKPSTTKPSTKKLDSLSKVKSDDSSQGSIKVPSKLKSSESSPSIGALPAGGLDAPVSAVNAGERRVLVRCKQSSINLPIMPSTTAMDLTCSAANVLNLSVAPSAAIVIEKYTTLGLERRVRRYEHIRNIMNSWDRDTQNALVLQSSESPNHDVDLESVSVPKKIPSDFTAHMYHSQKPGKWSKRYITLLSTGQIFISKSAGAKATDKDIVTICHLTDFDIYSVATQQALRNIKPPKKHCHAIKSQQKTAMFLIPENFVHFFCTDDAALSEKWYNAVQRWRSWYLVNILGAGKKESPRPPLNTRQASGKSGPQSPIPDERSYTIGSFKPLMDTKKMSDVDDDDENRPRQIPFHLRNNVVVSPNFYEELRRHPPPVSLTRKISRPSSPAEHKIFEPNGLLGRTYTQQVAEQKEREVSNTPEGPFVPGPTLLNSDSPRPSTSIQREGQNLQRHLSTRQGTSAGPGLARTASKRAPPLPLVDLSPAFVELPQWNMQGKGKGVVAPEGVRLVDAARSKETALAT